MKTTWVKTSLGQYPIHVDSGCLSRIGALIQEFQTGGRIAVVTQSRIAKHYLKTVQTSLKQKGFDVFVYQLPDGELAKCEKELFRLYQAILKQGFERKDGILALGGGVTGDLAGFAAATYMRGIRFYNAGTTLLAQVDSSIGGKTGINLGEGKNLVGAFYPPKLVLSDIAVFQTLPEREFRASLAEVVKYGIIRSSELFSFLEDQSEQVLKREERTLEYLVCESVKIKAQVVSHDEFETRGERMILNYGHTFGHGFEQAAGYAGLLHGEAVALGMVCAARLSLQLKILSEYEEKRIEALLLKLGLPISLSYFKLKTASVLKAVEKDKKKSAGKLKWVLPTHIGNVLIREDVPSVTLQKILREAGAK